MTPVKKNNPSRKPNNAIGTPAIEEIGENTAESQLKKLDISQIALDERVVG